MKDSYFDMLTIAISNNKIGCKKNIKLKSLLVFLMIYFDLQEIKRGPKQLKMIQTSASCVYVFPIHLFLNNLYNEQLSEECNFLKLRDCD